MNQSSETKVSSVSHQFKLTMVMLVFFLALFRLVDIFYIPIGNIEVEILSDRILVWVVLFILIYLWVQEVRDFHNLLLLNKNLQVAHEELKEAEVDTIASLIRAEEEKDSYTYGHSDRVTKIALAIANEIGLEDTLKGNLARAGVLHDIGKIGISDAILLKKEKLTDEEWEVVKSHSLKGIKILQPLKFLAVEDDIILHHHERYNGTGYPDKLKDNEIPIGAQILAVADAFDAMNSKRAYREPLSKEAIISELKKSRGTQHSPKIVDIFLQMLEKNPQLWNR